MPICCGFCHLYEKSLKVLGFWWQKIDFIIRDKPSFPNKLLCQCWAKQQKSQQNRLLSHRQSFSCCAPVGSSLDGHRSNSHTAGLCLKTSDTSRQLILRQWACHTVIQDSRFCPRMRETFYNSEICLRWQNHDINQTLCFIHPDKHTYMHTHTCIPWHDTWWLKGVVDYDLFFNFI